MGMGRRPRGGGGGRALPLLLLLGAAAVVASASAAAAAVSTTPALAPLLPGGGGAASSTNDHDHDHHHNHSPDAPCGHSRVAHVSRRLSQLHSEQQDRERRRRRSLLSAAGGDDAAALVPAAAANLTTTHSSRRLHAAEEKLPIRIWVEYQGVSELSDAQRDKLTRTVGLALGVLRKYLAVRRPAPGRLRVRPLCVMWASAGYCIKYSPDVLDGAGGSGGGGSSKGISMSTFFGGGLGGIGGEGGGVPTLGGDENNQCGLAAINASHIAPYRQCAIGGGGCRDYAGGSGEPTDYYLYVTAVQDEHCRSGAVAWGLPCLYDQDTNRPVLGSANMCPYALQEGGASPGRDQTVAVLVHELMHALGFTDDSFDKFVTPDGQPIPKDEVVRTAPDPWGRPVQFVVSPSVLRETKKQFGCDSVVGAALEGEGGTGSAGAHWEYRWFQGDLMVATNLFSVYGRRATMSRVTLAFMEDSGWYVPFWENAGLLDWGLGAGCAFVEKTCADFVASNPDQRFYCTKKEWQSDVNSVCTFDHLARARCEDTQFGDGCVMRVALASSPNCLDPRYETSGGNIFGWHAAPGSRCMPVTWLFKTTSGANGVEYQFPDSSYKQGWRDAVCYKASCADGGGAGSGNSKKLQIDVLGTKLDCPAGETIDLARAMPSKFQQGSIGPCPDAASLCGGLACGEACTSGGQCHEGQCFCDLEFTGKDCGKRLTPSGGWEDYVPLPGGGDGEDGGGSGGGAGGSSPFFAPGGASSYVIVSADLRNSQEDLLRSLDRYKSAVAGLAGVGVSRVSVISYTIDRPAASILGKKKRRRAILAASSENGGGVRVDSRVSTTSPADADAITARVKDPERLAKFGEELKKSGLELVDGSVAVQAPAAGAGGLGGVFGGVGSLFQGMGGSEAERIAIIVGVAVGAVVLLALVGWAVARAVRARRRRREEAAAAAALARLNGGGGPWNGRNGGSGSRVAPLRGAVAAAPGVFDGPRYASSTSAARQQQQQQQQGASYAPPPPPPPSGGLYTVAGRAFTSRDDAEQYALALAVARSLGEPEPAAPPSALALPPAAAAAPAGRAGALSSHPPAPSPSFVQASAPPPTTTGRTPRTSGASGGGGGGGAYPSVRF